MTIRISPTTEELQEARELITDSLSKAEAAFPTTTSAIIGLGWSDDDIVVEYLDGARGFASYPNRIQLVFNTTVENWKSSLKSTSIHEYAHVWGYDQRGRESEKKWEYILEEAFTQHIAEQLVPEYQSPSWTEYDTITVGAYWENIKQSELDKDSEEAGPIFLDHSHGGYPLGLGYSLSYQLGQELLSNHELCEFPEVSKAEVIRVGDCLYQN